MGFFNRFERTERILILMGSAGLMICLSLLYLIDKYANENILGQTVEIGTISTQENDTRHKSNGSFVWYPSRANQPIRIGDSVFAGDNSKTKIQLKRGGELTITENSLVRFREIEKQNVADLSTGNFILKVDGTVKVAINGSMTELEGKNSELQIKIAKNQKSQVRLISGLAKVKNKGKPSVQLDQRRVAYIEPEHVKPKPKRDPKPVAVSVAAPPPPMLIPEEAPEEVVEVAQTEPEPPPAVEPPKPYVYKLYDVYEQRDFQLFERELADANPLFLQGVEPSASVMTAEVVMPFDHAEFKATLSAPIDALGYVVQAGQNDSFAVGLTRTFWSAQPDLNLSFYHPGVYYYRFRTVNKNQELSEWSEVARFTVVRPPMPEPPVLLQSRTTGFTNEKFFAIWQPSGKTAIELTDASGALMKTRDGAKLVWQAEKAGHYQARAFTIDQYGRWSKPSPAILFNVIDKPVVIAPLAKTEEPQPEPKKEREVAAEQPKPESVTVLKVDSLVQSRNASYRGSKISLEGFSWAMMSTQTYFQKQQAPVATGAGLHSMNWFGVAGIEGRFKSAVFGVNETGKQSKLRDAEARGHLRLLSKFPFGLFRELQVSAFAGYEMYRNSGAYVSNQYDLIKFGTSLQFPMGERWASGGEFVYGLGTDGSDKKEMSGHLDYYFNRQWALGLGYRLHLFEAGSAKTAPMGLLPYREGYTEGYSTLDYNF